MTQHEDIGFSQIDAEHSGVVLQNTSLTRIEKDTHVFSFYPHRQAVLGNKPLTGLIVDQDRDFHGFLTCYEYPFDFSALHVYNPFQSMTACAVNSEGPHMPQISALSSRSLCFLRQNYRENGSSLPTHSPQGRARRDLLLWPSQ